MKLAEALILRADYQKRVEQLKDRLIRNSKIQEGEKPSEDPKDLIKELDSVLSELEVLIKQINRTNSKTQFENKMTLSDALVERDIIGLKRQVLRELIDSASIRQDRFSRSEIKYMATFDIKKTQKQMDDLSKDFRELDTKIQELNWKTDLMN